MTATNLILIVAAVAVFLGAEAVYHLVAYSGERRREELRRRLQATVGEGEASLLREQRIARSPGVAQLLAPLPGVQKLNTLLLQTDMNATVASLLGLSTIVTLSIYVALSLFARTGALVALIAFPLGYGLPLFSVYVGRGRRSRNLSEQLPDALDMIVRALRAGHGIASGFKLVATEMAEPVAVEFARCFEEQRLGVSLRDAVRNMTLRVPNNLDLKIFAVSLSIQHETGGNLIEILDQISSTVRARYQFFGKLRALTAEARYSGIVLGLLPFFCLAVVAILNPGYLEPLGSDPLGVQLAVGGAVLWVVGVFWMHRVAQVDY